MSRMAQVLATARPNFLPLAPLCVGVGVAAAWREAGAVDAAAALLALIGGVLAHAAVNLLNEYDDFRSGLDAITARTPFSGGSGTLPAHPDAARATAVAGIVSVLAVVAIGLYFVVMRGAGIVPLGVLGLLLVVAYTPRITRQPLLCLLAPGLGFGPVMVIGTAYVLTGEYGRVAMAASLVPMALVSGLLLLNQFPDIEADWRIGRRHLPIVLGRAASARIYAALVLIPPVAVTVACAAGLFSPWAVLALLTAPLSAFLAIGVVRRAADDRALMPLMGLNVVLVLGTILLLGVGLAL